MEAAKKKKDMSINTQWQFYFENEELPSQKSPRQT
jgi:hypothetical protein